MDANQTIQIAKAVQIGLELTQGAAGMLAAAGQVAELISVAQSQGRDLTEEDFAKLDAGDDVARKALADAIAKHQAVN